ncbi:hypothetical protein LTR17_022296 [Elasticomyces elasticus]|nr:hypothetical protein LTR17_022296 [Elasticomyces elasticus]
MTHGTQHIRIAHGVGALYGVWTVGSVFTIAVRNPIKSPWQNRDGFSDLFIRWTIVEALGCALDLGAVVFSAYLVWTLQMPLKRRVSVTAIFATRLFIWPIIALRLWKLLPGQNTDTTMPSIAAEILTEVAMETALNLASVTCVKPFLRPFQEGGYISTTTPNAPASYGITGASRSRSEAYLMLGTAGSTVKNKDGSIMHTATQKELDDAADRKGTPRVKLRADGGRHEAACEHDGRGYGHAAPKVIRVSRTVQVQNQ